ncbi:hypothetical protein C9374_001516 [Naegleria lovaniensis]|uniref:Uncharacterized protein n=1 Tax=Naegleria lovaniensis TaxID=51637 RepID=A0AA88GWV4_NAELO|nr:uncharacterized protein C9374_001516 [Naegleria lovaniensis]KAG2387184.1 hypothetical protein C9374_001516 [Naegleria lovaniensis]
MKRSTVNNHKRTKSSSGGAANNYSTRLPLAALLLPVHPSTYAANCHPNVSSSVSSFVVSKNWMTTGKSSSTLDSSPHEDGSETSPPPSPQSPWTSSEQLSNATRMSPSNTSSSLHRESLEKKWSRKVQRRPSNVSHNSAKSSNTHASTNYEKSAVSVQSTANANISTVLSSIATASSSTNNTLSVDDTSSVSSRSSSDSLNTTKAQVSNDNLSKSTVPQSEIFGSVEALRSKYLDYIKMCGMQTENSQDQQLRMDMDMEFEVKLLFLDYVYDGVSRKIHKHFKDIPSIMNMLETYCHHLVYTFDGWHFQQDDFPSTNHDMNPPPNYPYLKYMVEHVLFKQKWFSHQRFSKFLQVCFENSLSNQFPSLRNHEMSTEDSLNTTNTCSSSPMLSNSSIHSPMMTLLPTKPPNISNAEPIGILDEIQMLCEMFYYELEDYFVLFQQKYQSYVDEWIEIGLKKNLIPSHVIEAFRDKLQFDETMQSQFSVNAQDFVSPYVIDRDFKFLKYLAKEYSADWNCSYKEIPNRLFHWSTKKDYSSDPSLKLRNCKLVGYLDESIENVVKSFCHDDHMSFTLNDMEFHDYSPIHPTKSTQKYPYATVSGHFNTNSILTKRRVEVVVSCTSTFVGQELVEHLFLYKSCQIPSLENKVSKNDIRTRFMGLRLISKIDENTTRYVEMRVGNLGGILNSNLVMNSSVVNKKMVQVLSSGLKNFIERKKEQGFPFPNPEKENIARVWMEYCQQYCGLNVEEMYNNK